MFIEPTEDSKQESPLQVRFVVSFVLWYEWSVFFCVYVLFTFMHVLNFMLWICVLCFNIWDDYMARFYYFMISRKEVPRKFWLDPRFPRNPKLKWILKQPPLDRGYFKVYFFSKGESFLIISCHIYLLTRNLSFYFKSCSHCHALYFDLNCPVFRYY